MRDGLSGSFSVRGFTGYPKSTLLQQLRAIERSKDDALSEGGLADQLGQLDIDEIDRLLDQIAEGRQEREATALVLRMLAHDPRIYVRMRVAELASTLEQLDEAAAEEVVGRLISDPRPVVRQEAMQALSGLLWRMDSLERLRMMLEWSASEDQHQRAAIAAAMTTNATSAGVLTVVEHLTRDSFAEVRQHAADAALALWNSGVTRGLELLVELMRDNRRSVRLAAIRALGQLPCEVSAEPLFEATLSLDPETAETAAAMIASQPDHCVEIYERLVANMELIDERAMLTLISPITRFAQSQPAQTRRLLRQLQAHPVPWLSEEALLAEERTWMS